MTITIASRLTNNGTLLVNGSFDENTSISPSNFRTTSTTVYAGTLDEASLTCGAISFNGSTQYLTAPASSNWAFGTGDFTVEAWAYFTAVGTNYVIVGNRQTTSNAEWWLVMQSSKMLFLGGTTNYLTGVTTLVINKWYHIAATRQSGTFRLFLNGVLDVTNTPTVNSFSSTAWPLGIGDSSDQNQYFFPGYISNLRIVNGTAVYTAAFTPPQAILPVITNTKLLLNSVTSTNFIQDTGPNNVTLTNVGSTTWTSNGPFLQGSTILKQRQLNDGTLQVLTQFDEVSNMIVTNGLLLYVNGAPGVYSGTGTQWSDLSSYNNNATLTNSPTYSASTGGGSFAFDGSTQYAPITTALLNTTYTGKTVFIVGRMNASAWTPGVAQYRAMYGTASGTRNFNFYVYHDASNLFYFHYSTPGSAILTGSVALTTGTWFIAAVAQDATTTTVYLNGTSVYSVGGQTLNQYSASGQEAVAKADNYWYGDIAVCALYSRALSAAEVLNNYNAFAARVGL